MASKTVIINGVEYTTVPEVDIPISGGGGALAKFFEISDATIASDGSDMLVGAVAYDSTGVKRTGTIPNGTATTPTTTITPSVQIQQKSYWEAGSPAYMYRALVSGEQNVTPNVSAGYITQGTAGTITVISAYDFDMRDQIPNLVSDNIRAGVTIIGVEGNPNVVNTSIASASAATGAAILSPYQAYVNGELVTGSVTTKTSSDLTVAGPTVTAPAGYYATDASATVQSGSATTPTKTITANPAVTIDTAGLITATVTGSSSITPTVSAGYVTSGNAGTVSVSGSKTLQLAVPTQLTVSGGTVTAPSGYYPSALSKTLGTGAITASGSAITIEPVASINNSTGVVSVATQTQNVTVNANVSTAGYVTSAQNSSATVAVTLKDSTTLALTTKAAATYTPGTQAQSVPSYRWLTGAQTIAGDADLVSANIKKGVNIFGVAGSSTVVDTNDATATSADLLSGKTAYVKGAKVTGNIATKSSADLTVSGKTVTAPAGYYASAASKSVANGSAKTPATTITATATPSLNTSTGVVSITVSGSSSVTPTVTAGYVTTGTAGTITVSGSSSLQLTTKTAQTYTPGTADITIAAGQYLTGAQTIKGDQNLQAGYIVAGKSIFGVEGTLSLPVITQNATTKVLTIS